MKPPMGHTTQPAADTGEGSGGGASRIVIIWGFPAPAFSVLTAGHVLGRDVSCHTVLTGHEVSRQHAKVHVVGIVPVLEDLGSRNGLFVNGHRVQDRPVGPGDVIRLGEWVGVAAELPTKDRAPKELRAIVPGWYGGPRMAQIAESVRRVAVTDLPIVVEGETGTGKEGAARAVHTWSGRAGDFIAVNCAALTETLAEGELFGYRRGAFTGADRASLGHFRAANGGTLFLDEILELSSAVQAKLLRAIEQHEVVPLGESHPIPVDVRMIAATQESLASTVRAGRFRADLLGRLDGLTVRLPPLRERREDIIPLFLHFLAEQSGGRAPQVETKLAEALALYDWPLNVRELALLTRRLLAVHGHEEVLKRSTLPDRMTAGRRASTPPEMARSNRASTADETEFEALLAAVREQGGNISKAAAALGITRARAYRLLDARPDFDRGNLRKGVASENE